MKIQSLLVTICLGLLTHPSMAVLIIDDHFTGNSGGIPAGWANANPGATSLAFNESGTNVAISAGPGGGPGIMTSTTTFSSTTPPPIVITADVTSATTNGQTVLSVGQSSSFFGLVVQPSGSVDPISSFGGSPPSLGDAGDPLDGIQLTFTLNATSFTIASDESFSVTSPYTAVNAAFTSLSDLGSTIGMGLGMGAAASDVETVLFDRLRLDAVATNGGGGNGGGDAAAAVPEATSLAIWGLVVVVGGGYGWRRRKGGRQKAEEPEKGSGPSDPRATL